jgi:predicted enzyme related to lactoylglutathione lyase
MNPILLNPTEKFPAPGLRQFLWIAHVHKHTYTGNRRIRSPIAMAQPVLSYCFYVDLLHSFRKVKIAIITMSDQKNYKVQGIGGIFFKCENPQKVKDWYSDNLGLVTDEYGSLFEFRNADDQQMNYLQWSPFDAGTTYFKPSEKEFMINYRVGDLDKLVEELKKNGVTILDEIETYEYGKFVHIMDPEGNKIELWEAVDDLFTKSHEGKTTH